MEEVWKDIEGFEGLYQVSNIGNVKSLVNNKGVAREKVLKPTIVSVYLHVNLYKNKTRKTYNVHRLVAKAFLPNPQNYPCVNHRDENGENNNVENLEWCSYKYNTNYGSRNERAGKANTNNQNRSKAISKALTNNTKISKAVVAFKKDELVMVFPSTNEAGRQGFDQSNVAACCRNCYMREGNNVYKGYEWRYL